MVAQHPHLRPVHHRTIYPVGARALSHDKARDLLADCPPIESLRSMLALLMWHARADGIITANIDDLAVVAGVSYSTARRQLRELRAYGVLTSIQRGNGYTRSIWRLRIEDVDPTTGGQP